ncbi:RNA-binding protein [Ignicoccus islandicus DSM 13165]|uniref:RNA-binding protein n=1 Tax=Ignicoccus islandicus DSM 13165 TaxID=940295 RepID=A0A0U2WKD3_9CREN|nr:DUF655 domain-containing protein [Ignicoccus islandicus]ALU11409.1 RNA-binding protein [Ignicoccus islandicus DSM 13165]
MHRRPHRRHHPHSPLSWLQVVRVLDFMPQGNPLDHHAEHRSRPFAQALDETKLKLIEFGVKEGSSLKIGERVSFRPLDERIIPRVYLIKYEDLSTVAQENLPEVLRNFVKDNEKLFVTFLNVASPITLKFHALELLPHIGKKTLKQILEERERKPFESFEDFEKRTGYKDIVEGIVERILKELQGGEKYYLFVEPPPRSNAVFLNYLEKVRSIARSGSK